MNRKRGQGRPFCFEFQVLKMSDFSDKSKGKNLPIKYYS
jgi:hypothetical protein